MQKVKWFIDEKGYGFIKYKDNGDVLICYSISEDEYIEIELAKTDNGYKKKNIVTTKEVV